MSTLIDKYGEFFYGDKHFYGAQVIVPTAFSPTNFYVIRENDYYILHWTAPTYNQDGSPCTPTSYKIFRTEHTNTVDETLIKTITTTNYDGTLDTCFVDKTIDPLKHYFYQVTCINQYNTSSPPTNWETDILMAKDQKYTDTGIYSTKNNFFWKLLEDIPESQIFDKEPNIVPYTPKSVHILVYTFPTIPYGTVLSVYVNNSLVGKNYNRDFFYFILPTLPYSDDITIEIRNDAGTTTYKTIHYKTYNYLMYISALSTQLKDSWVNIWRTQNDLYIKECSFDKLYANFGSLVRLLKPRYLTNTQYRDLIIGTSTTSGVFNAYLNGGTFEAIKGAIKSVTGAQPDISTYRDSVGWIIRTGSGIATSGTNATEIYCSTQSWAVDAWKGYVVTIKGKGSATVISNTATKLVLESPGITGATIWDFFTIARSGAKKYVLKTNKSTDVYDNQPISLFSIPYKAFTLRLTVWDPLKWVKGEEIISSAYIDYLDGTNILLITNVIDELGNSYALGVDFTLNTVTGAITWIGNRPPIGRKYYVDYIFVLKDIVVQLAESLKQDQYRLVYEWGYGFGLTPFGLYPFGESTVF